MKFSEEGEAAGRPPRSDHPSPPGETAGSSPDIGPDDADSDRRATFAPHIQNGVISLAELRNLAESLESLGAEKVKLGGEAVFVWPEGEKPTTDPAIVTGKEGIVFSAGGVRPVKLCSAETFCGRNQRPVLDLAATLDKLYFGKEMESKVVIGVAGCQRSCSEPAVKDVGIIATGQGYDILVGGAAGLRPRVAQKIHTAESEEEVIELVGKIVDYVALHGKRLVRLGALVEKRGIGDLQKWLGLKPSSGS